MKETVSILVAVFFSTLLFQDHLLALSRKAPRDSNVVKASSQGGQLISPLCGCNRCRSTSSFGPRWGRLHAGHDFACKVGTPIKATSAGVVRFAGGKGAYGNRVEIGRSSMLHLASGGVHTADQDIETSYSHLSEIRVKPGDRVQAGDVIGTCGSTGRSTGPHLHYEVRIGGVPKDPQEFFKGDILRNCPSGPYNNGSGVEV